MKKRVFYFLFACALFSFDGIASTQEMKENPSIRISVGSQVFHANLLLNESTVALVRQLPFTLSMVELNRNEKYAELKQALPTQTEPVGKIQAGDLLLYGNNVLVLFYESFSTPYRYTRIGRISEIAGLKKALGTGNCQVKFELNH